MATIYTSAGEAAVADLIDGVSSTHYDASNAKIGWGTGAGTAAKGDTTLFVEASESRVVPAVDQPATDTNRWIGTLTADGGKTITNAAVFDAATTGNMLVKGDFTGIILALNDKIEFTITLQQN